MHYVSEYKYDSDGNGGREDFRHLRIVATCTERCDAKLIAQTFEREEGGYGYQYEVEVRPGEVGVILNGGMD